MNTLIDTQAVDLPRVRSSRPDAIRVVMANAQPRALSAISLPTTVPAPAYAALPSTCGWQQMTEAGRGSFRADAIAQDGRLADFGGAYVTTFKHSTRSGQPSCSPPA